MDTQAVLGLLLYRSPDGARSEHDVYGCGLVFDERKTARLVILQDHSPETINPFDVPGKSEALDHLPILLTPLAVNPRAKADMRWSTLHILHRIQPDMLHGFGTPSLEAQWHAGFMFSRWSLFELQHAGFELERVPECILTRVSATGERYRERERTAVRLVHWRSGEAFEIILGRCGCVGRNGAAYATANVRLLPPNLHIPSGQSSLGFRELLLEPCMTAGYHVCEWDQWSRTFGDVERSVQLTFSVQSRKAQWHPVILATHSLYFIVEVKVSGNVYSQLTSTSSNSNT